MSSDIHNKAISQEMSQPSITKICLKITCLKFHSNFSRANELTTFSHLAFDWLCWQLMRSQVWKFFLATMDFNSDIYHSSRAPIYHFFHYIIWLDNLELITTFYLCFNSLRPSAHICIGKLTIIGSDNDLSPGWHQAIIWTNAGISIVNWNLRNKTSVKF